MKFEEVRPRMGRLVYFDTGQLNMDGCSMARSVIPNGELPNEVSVAGNLY